MVEEKREWVKLSVAADVCGVSQSMLSSLVKQGKIATDSNPRDARQTLVDLVELRKRFRIETQVESEKQS